MGAAANRPRPFAWTPPAPFNPPLRAQERYLQRQAERRTCVHGVAQTQWCRKCEGPRRSTEGERTA